MVNLASFSLLDQRVRQYQANYLLDTNRGSEKPIMIRSSATTMVRWTAKELMDDADPGRIVPVPSQHAEHWVR